MNYILSLLILIPFIGMLFTLFIKYPDTRAVRNVRNVKLIVTVAQMLLCFIMLFFNRMYPDENFFFSGSSAITHLSFELMADGLSLLFMTFASVFFVLVTLMDWNSKIKMPKDYSALFLWLESMTFGIFCSGDIISFIFFFTGAIIPLCILLRIYSFTDKDRYFLSPLFFLIFSCAGILMFCLLLLGRYSDSYLLSSLSGYMLSVRRLFFIKTLLLLSLTGIGYVFPLLASDRCNTASTPWGIFYTASVIPFISGIYTCIRVLVNMPSVNTGHLSTVFYIVAGCGLCYLSLKTVVQKDLRKVIGCYSNIYVTICFIGVLSSSYVARQGSFLLTLNYVPVLAVLIFVTAIIHDKVNSSHIFEVSGLCQVMPFFANLFFITCVCVSFFPLTGGFSGIILTVEGLFASSGIVGIITVLAAMTLAAYIFYSYQNIALGILPDRIKSTEDISLKSGLLLLTCLGLSFGLGIFPDWFLAVAGNSF
jgi:NADH-quinone oxidoreductase subunit M